MRLYKVEDVHRNFQILGCSKLKNLVTGEDFQKQASLTEGDTSDSSRISENPFINNISVTLDKVLKCNKPEKENTLILICGSFFIMSDVRKYFGIPQEVD